MFFSCSCTMSQKHVADGCETMLVSIRSFFSFLIHLYHLGCLEMNWVQHRLRSYFDQASQKGVRSSDGLIGNDSLATFLTAPVDLHRP